jgi:hypothetical protein
VHKLEENLWTNRDNAKNMGCFIFGVLRSRPKGAHWSRQ